MAGCPDNPYKAETWINKLGNAHEAERAVTELGQLGDPSAIEPLGNAWLTQGKPGRWLDVIIALARPLTPEQAATGYFRDYESAGRPASWDKAVPFLKKAVSEIDEANQHSLDAAVKAADALGDSRNPDALDALIELAQKKPTKKLRQSQIAAIHAIGKFTGDSKASGALITLVQRDLPPNPRTIKEKDQTRAAAEAYGLALTITAASIDALGDLHVAAAAKPLVVTMFRTPELLPRLRRALVASGPASADELRSVLSGTQPEVSRLTREKHLDTYCGDRNDTQECLPVSALVAYPATVLGDMYDAKAVPLLLAALKQAPVPVGYLDDQPSAATQYDAIFSALRKIGSPEGASDIRAMWMGGHAAEPAKPARGKPAAAAPAQSELTTRVMAIDTYPFVTRDDAGTDELGRLAADDKADASLRQGAATAFARLAHDTKDIAVLQGLAQRYADASAKKRAEADGKPKQLADAADKELAKAKKAHDDTIHARSTQGTADEVKAVIKKADAAYAEAAKLHAAAVEAYKTADGQAKLYKGFQRMFQTHIAQVSTAMRCKQSLECYAGTLKLTPKAAAEQNASYIKDIKTWQPDEQLGLVEASVERAMLEIGKRGTQASGLTGALLDSAKNDDRVIRQAILLALPKIAKVPCADCEAKLQAVIRAGEGKTTLAELNLDTTMMKNYFGWAGGKTPSTRTSDEDLPVSAEPKPIRKK